MSERVAADVYEDYWGRETPPPLNDPLRPTRWRLLFERLTAPCRLLDCGAGDGSLVAEALDRGNDAWGLELAEGAIARARKDVVPRMIRHSAEQRPWPVDGAFDVVVAFEVLEHLLRPQELVAGAFDVLRPGGLLALTTPYHGILKNVAIAAVAFDRHFDPEGDHIRFFSDRALRRLLGDAGFVVVDVAHFGRAPLLWAGTFMCARRLG